MLKVRNKNGTRILIHDGDSIGGRNLLLESGTPKTINVPLATVEWSSTLLGIFNLAHVPVVGEDYTVTFKISGHETIAKWGIWNTDDNCSLYEHDNGYVPFAPTKLAENIYSYSFKWKNGGLPNRDKTLKVFVRNSSANCTTTLHWIKLERGLISTDWTPAPEDFQ